MLPNIYCILITGKNEDRYKFIPIAINNFNEQTYQNKYLLIINHGSKQIVDIHTQKNITEIMFDKTNFTLGDMRNFALDQIPFENLWCVWDDDDYRHPKYIELLYKYLIDNKADVVFFKNRIDYNINNNFAYRSKFINGMPFVLAKKTEKVRYLSKDSIEDIQLQIDYKNNNKKIIVINNNPMWYIRLIHTSNTSLYVDNEKNSIVEYGDESTYYEFNLTDIEQTYADKIINKYFTNI